MPKYLVLDTKHGLYNLGYEDLNGLGLRAWGHDAKQAQKLPHARALILVNAMNARTNASNRFILQEVKL